MMITWRSVLMVAAVAVGLGFCSSAKANPISYSYSGSPGFEIVHPDSGNGGIAFVGNSGTGNAPGGGALGSMLYSIPSGAGTIGTFTNVAFSTGLTITDSGAPGSPHTFTFSGLLNGTLDSGTNTLSSTLNTPTTQQFQIGSNMYSVTINNLALPGFGSPGAVTYNVAVAPAGVQPTPEPSTLLLSGLGAGCLGIFSWRRRRQADKLVSTAA